MKVVKVALTQRCCQVYLDSMNSGADGSKPVNYNAATVARAKALDTLIRAAESIAGAEDYGDMIGAVRMVELAAAQARRAIVDEARAAGETWQTIGDALGISRQAAHERFS